MYHASKILIAIMGFCDLPSLFQLESVMTALIFLQMINAQIQISIMSLDTECVR